MTDNAATSDLLSPAEVASMFRVNPKTVSRWARSGKIAAIRTLGGHRRFRRDEVAKVLAELTTEATQPAGRKPLA